MCSYIYIDIIIYCLILSFFYIESRNQAICIRLFTCKKKKKSTIYIKKTVREKKNIEDRLSVRETKNKTRINKGK